MVANHARGEVVYNAGENHKYKLCLTLGALAEIETALGVEDMSKIDETFKKPSTKHLLSLFLALAHGGGHVEMTEEDLMKVPLDVSQLQGKILGAFKVAGLADEDGDNKDGDNKEGN